MLERECERTAQLQGPELWPCQDNRRSGRPVKGEARKWAAHTRALDRPTRRFWDGYKEMG
jgi:hypothetical protein